MISVGDSVWIENDELGEVDLIQLKVIEIKQKAIEVAQKASIGIKGTLLKLEDGFWYAQEEVFVNKKDLIKFLIEQNKENQEELALDIKAVIHELEDLKEKVRTLGFRQDILKKIKETI